MKASTRPVCAEAMDCEFPLHTRLTLPRLRGAVTRGTSGPRGDVGPAAGLTPSCGSWPRGYRSGSVSRSSSRMIHVPYRGGAPMITDLIGGQIQVALDVLTGPQTGTLRALAVAGRNRVRQANPGGPPEKLADCSIGSCDRGDFDLGPLKRPLCRQATLVTHI